MKNNVKRSKRRRMNIGIERGKLIRFNLASKNSQRWGHCLQVELTKGHNNIIKAEEAD